MATMNAPTQVTPMNAPAKPAQIPWGESTSPGILSDHATNQELDASTRCSVWGDRRNSATRRVLHSDSAKALASCQIEGSR